MSDSSIDFKHIMAIVKSMRDDRRNKRAKLRSIHYEPVFPKKTKNAATER